MGSFLFVEKIFIWISFGFRLVILLDNVGLGDFNQNCWIVLSIEWRESKSEAVNKTIYFSRR